MTESFNVGDIAIIVNSKKSHWNGQEVTILSTLREHPGRTPRHEITNPEGDPDVRCYAPPSDLRKKRPPPQFLDISTTRPLQVTSWSDCPWKPESLHV